MATPTPLEEDFMEVFSKPEIYNYHKEVTTPSTMTPDDMLLCEKCEGERYLHPRSGGLNFKNCLMFKEKETYTSRIKKTTFSMTRFIKNKVIEFVQTVRNNIVEIMCIGLPTVVYYLDESKDFGKREMYTSLALSGLFCLNVANRYKFSRFSKEFKELEDRNKTLTRYQILQPRISLGIPSVIPQVHPMIQNVPSAIPSQIVEINNQRENLVSDYDKSYEMPQPLTGEIGTVNIPKIEEITQKNRFYFW